MERLMDTLMRELENISNKGLTTSNLDTAYKIVKMYNKLKEVEHWDNESGNSYNGGSYNDGSSSRRSHYVRGHYSRDGYNNGDSYGGYSSGDSYGQYMDSKRAYRSNRSGDCKARMMDTLEDYMEDFTRQMEELARDADCQEERETINRYIAKIKQL